jgi:hypothetical protein
MPARVAGAPKATTAAAPVTVRIGPAELKLKGILWSRNGPLALINNETLAVREERRVRIGQTNELIRCLAIDKETARILLLGSGKEMELSLEHR